MMFIYIPSRFVRVSSLVQSYSVLGFQYPAVNTSNIKRPSTASLHRMAPLLPHFVSGLLVGACLTGAHSTHMVTTTWSEKACQSLAQSLGPKTLSSGAQYNTTAKSAWNFFNQLDVEKVHDSMYGLVAHCLYIISEPTCIIFPRNTSEELKM